VSEPTGPCAVYARGVAYSDEVFFIDPDPMLDAALRAWRTSGDPDEVLSLLQHQDEHFEYPDAVMSVHRTCAEAEAAIPGALAEVLRSLTFVDFGFSSYGIRRVGSARWYSTEDDDDKWSELFDSQEASIEAEDDVPDLLAWCDKHSVPRPTVKNRDQLLGISARAMEPAWSDMIDDQADAFLADVVVEQLRSANRDDLIADLWTTLVGQIVFVGPAPSRTPVEFDLRRMSVFRERKIDTSGFSASSLDGEGAYRYKSAQPVTQHDPRATEAPRKGLFSRIFGK
jgi:hypothetical protein